MARVLITGTSTGIGMDTAIHLGRVGYDVVATMRRPDRSPELQEIVTREELPVQVLALDVDNDASVREAVGAALGEGPIDVLVNNAGIASWSPLEETPIAQLQQVLETNVVGPVRCVQAVLPSMRERGSGLIINVSSVAGRLVPQASGAYSASKFALEAVSEALAQEVRPHGIRVAILEPGIFATPIVNEKRTYVVEDSAYPAQRRMRALFDAAPQASTALVSGMIQEIIESDSEQLRWLAGPDAAGWLAWRETYNDEEWVAFNGTTDDEEWYARIERDTGMDVRPTG